MTERNCGTAESAKFKAQRRDRLYWYRVVNHCGEAFMENLGFPTDRAIGVFRDNDKDETFQEDETASAKACKLHFFTSSSAVLKQLNLCLILHKSSFFFLLTFLCFFPYCLKNY